MECSQQYGNVGHKGKKFELQGVKGYYRKILWQENRIILLGKRYRVFATKTKSPFITFDLYNLRAPISMF